MSIRIPSTPSVQPANLSGTEKSKSAEVQKDAPNVLVEAKSQLNTSIINASMAVSISSGNDSLTLLLKSAITGINELLEPEFGENALQNAASQDNTSEATAQRIVSLSTGFFEAYKQKYPDQDDATTLANFMETIRSGFESGFGEASDILKGMNVLNGDIASNIDKTYALVQKGFADFEAARKPSVTE